MILYYLVPSHIMEDTARHIAKCIRSLFLRGFEKIERNIIKWFYEDENYDKEDAFNENG
jgi:hypothetical protein